MRSVQTIDPVRTLDPPVQIGIAGTSACLQIDIISGAKRNPQSDFGSTAIFFGSDPECDFVLSGDSFPPMYAFVLVDSQGAVVRFLGGGPTMFLDQKPITRHRITKTASITGGPLSLKLHISSRGSAVDPSSSIIGHRHIPLTDFDPSCDEEIRVEKSIQLIEQASRLLASISDRKADKRIPPMMTQDPNSHHHRDLGALSLSVGRPSTGQLPPIWHHICFN